MLWQKWTPSQLAQIQWHSRHLWKISRMASDSFCLFIKQLSRWYWGFQLRRCLKDFIVFPNSRKLIEFQGWDGRSESIKWRLVLLEKMVGLDGSKDRQTLLLWAISPAFVTLLLSQHPLLSYAVSWAGGLFHSGQDWICSQNEQTPRGPAQRQRKFLSLEMMMVLSRSWDNTWKMLKNSLWVTFG